MFCAGNDGRYLPATKAFGPAARASKSAIPPVADVRMIEGWFKRFVFHQETLARTERVVYLVEGFGDPLLAMTNIRRAGIIRAVGQPGSQVAQA